MIISYLCQTIFWMLKITAIIPTFNEQDHILQAIESVSWADEIIVVDSYSTDKTVELALEKKVKIIKREYQYSASQKNWAIPQAANDWIFFIRCRRKTKYFSKR